MQMETKFLRLRTPVTLGSRFGDWQVTWLGGWGRHRFYYLVMVVKLPPLRLVPPDNKTERAPRLLRGHNPAALETDKCQVLAGFFLIYVGFRKAASSNRERSQIRLSQKLD
jgi:hypothetical protein